MVRAVEVLALLGDVEDHGTCWRARCPLHEEPTVLYVGTTRDGALRLKCRGGCRFDEIVAKLLPGRAGPVTLFRITIGNPFDFDPPLSAALRSTIPEIIEAVAGKLRLEHEESPKWDL